MKKLANIYLVHVPVESWASINDSVYVDSAGEYAAALPKSQHKFVDLAKLEPAYRTLIKAIAQNQKSKLCNLEIYVGLFKVKCYPF